MASKQVERNVDKKGARTAGRLKLRGLSIGDLEQVIDGIVAERRAREREYRRTLKEIGRQLRQLDSTERSLIIQRIVPTLHLEEVTETLAKASGGQLLPASFRASLTMRSKLRGFGNGYAPEWSLYDKLKSYKFMDELGVRRPSLHGSVVSLNRVPCIHGSVIKPIAGAGSRGVFLVLSDSEIIDVKGRNSLASWSQFQDRAREYLKTRLVRKDQWFVEELIPDDTGQDVAARDLKFYCFYGRVELVLEVRRYPTVRYCWWSGDGKVVRTGKYDDQLHVGAGFSQADVLLAERISSEIPAPFIRVDCLSMNDGMVFGEFTPRPGAYDAFDGGTDRRLGTCLLAADGRLISDLLAGKAFDTFAKHFGRADVAV